MILAQETLDVNTIKAAIESRRRQIAYIEDGLKYADHGAYGQDTAKIRDLNFEIDHLKRELERAEQAAEPEAKQGAAA